MAALPRKGRRRFVLKGQRRIALRRDPPSRRPARSGSRTSDSAAAAALPAAAEARFQALRAEQLRLARAQGVQPYVVLHDTTLRAIALARPTDLVALAAIPGIGSAKLSRYGKALLVAIAAGD